jgi:adenosylmethionine-8-amino-7-oxononanoate aminotransferase
VADAVGAAARQLGGTSLFRRSHIFAERLLELLEPEVPVSSPAFFFATSGSEASDTAMRIALAFWHGTGRSVFAYVPGSYHGVSLGPSALMGLEGYDNGYRSPVASLALPSYGEWVTDPGASKRSLERSLEAVGGELAAVFIEVIQGSGGVTEMPSGYAEALSAGLEACGALLVVDEVATGVFRTGTFLGLRQFPGLRADMVLLGKGLTAGMAALSVVAVDERVHDAVVADPSTHRVAGTTHAGNPLACAAAVATMMAFGDPENERLRLSGEKALGGLVRELADISGVETVTGRGHMWGLHFAPRLRPSVFVDTVTRAGLAEGLLLHPLSVGVLPIMPALTIGAAEVTELGERLVRVVERVTTG